MIAAERLASSSIFTWFGTMEEVDKQAEVMESGGGQESGFAEAHAVRHRGQQRLATGSRKADEPSEGTY
ncbi:hypothetical protein FJT64_011153 [Amphibalanus amphitrite]|uniref:Uncharacterized protein n=1 Tax=Amphibalanus amphitrite TaxID=1232801 RepID=A0A6A4V7V4_AMPAM|nr:hypothetical protein FJT64_011153 [Amphibalanus amphitrite]